MGFISDEASAGIQALQVTSTSSNPYADLFLNVPGVRIRIVEALFNAAGIQLQVLVLTGMAYRPYRDNVAAFNADLADYWADPAVTQHRVLARFRSVATSQAIVSHSQLLFTATPSTVPQAMHPHDSGFRLFGNQFALTAYEWNHAQQCTISGGTITANAGFGNSAGTGNPSFSNSGPGLRMMFTARHNRALDYCLFGYLNTASLSGTGSNLVAGFYISQGNRVEAFLEGVSCAGMAYAGELLTVEIWDDGVKFFVGATLLFASPNVPQEFIFWIGVVFYAQGGALLDVQAGGQTVIPR